MFINNVVIYPMLFAHCATNFPARTAKIIHIFIIKLYYLIMRESFKQEKHAEKSGGIIKEERL